MEGGTPGSRQFKKRLGLESHRIKFFRGMKRSGKVLDIGCGYGYFLAACREAGYDVHGLDFSESAVAHARKKLDLPITVGALTDANLSEQAFDVITLWHALEHMPDPQETIQKARMWLKPDGILAVDVPNYLGTDARKQGTNWNGWDLPYHYYHFTPKSLNRFLNKFDFQVVKQKNYHSEEVKEALKQIPFLSLFARPLAKFYSGHSISVIARLEK
jgi:2-polyprenyl-3-methyl-5-hydroxy-6-metoxy-1,4-benzoquinol methylase